MDPRPDAVALYSGCTPGPGFCQMTGTLPPLLDSVVSGGIPGQSCIHAYESTKARKLVAPQLSQTYAQATKSLTETTPHKSKMPYYKSKVRPPLKLLQPAPPLLKQNISASIPIASTSSSAQAHLVPSTSTISE
ncbi:hypothetical protein TNCV_4174991 [Trichonephila clavipes]|nr:hypothetical protein TNCV_4174991 [Trichonephila clavipes]